MAMLKVTCSHCEEEFERRDVEVWRHTNNYCSRTCSIAAQNKQLDCVCVNCGAKLTRSPSRMQIKNYCNMECLRQFQEDNSKGGLYSNSLHDNSFDDWQDWVS